MNALQTFFVCYSPSSLTCGSAHKDRQKALGCCKAHRASAPGRVPYPVVASSLGSARRQAAQAWGYTDAERTRKLEFVASKGQAPRAGSIPPVNNDPEGSPSTLPLDGTKADTQAGEQARADTQAQAQADTQAGEQAQAQAQAGEQAQAEPRADAQAGGSIQDAAQALALALASSQAQAPIDRETVLELIRETLGERENGTRVLTVRALPRNGQGPPKDLGLAHSSLPVLLSEIERGNNVLLMGEAGSGKTHGAEQAARALGRECFLIPQILDPFIDVSGYMDAQGAYVPSQIYRWAKAEPGAVLVLDEMDGSDPNALLRANALLAGGTITFPNGETVSVPQGHVVVGCANTWGDGPTAEFMGRAALDGASLDRFPSKLGWSIDSALEQAIALDGLETDAKLSALETVKVSQRIRENLKTHGVRVTWGPRNTFALVGRILGGDSLKKALAISNLAKLDDRQKGLALSGIEA